VESIRAGLVVGLKQAVGTDLIQAREERLWQHALERWQRNPNIELLGNRHARRLSIVSFRIRAGDRYLHHNFVVAVLNEGVRKWCQVGIRWSQRPKLIRGAARKTWRTG
jgi:selenocysteine lyase/cysteine desulfurase